MNQKTMHLIIGAIEMIFIFILAVYFIKDYKKNNSPSVKEYINNNLGSIFFSLGLLFSFFGLITMISNLIEQICNLADETGVYNGFAVLVFGVSLFSIAGSIQQTRKSNEENIQFKNGINSKLDEISNKLESLNPSNVDLHDEIEKLKEQNQEIIVLLKEKNQTNVHIYVNEEDKSKKTRKNGEYKK